MKIVIEANFLSMSKEHQDYWFKKARDNDVFCIDDNGDMWQVLALTIEKIDRDEYHGEGLA